MPLGALDGTKVKFVMLACVGIDEGLWVWWVVLPLGALDGTIIGPFVGIDEGGLSSAGSGGAGGSGIAGGSGASDFFLRVWLLVLVSVALKLTSAGNGGSGIAGGSGASDFSERASKLTSDPELFSWITTPATPSAANRLNARITFLLVMEDPEGWGVA